MKCKNCGKDIKFYKLPRGSAMPVDRERYFYKDEGKGKDRLAKFDGKGVRIISCTICNVDDEGLQGFGFLPHFASCRSFKKLQESASENIEQLKFL